MPKDLFVIASVCQQGVSGKSTTSTNVLVCALREGVKAVILDLDPQGSSLDWAQIHSAADQARKKGPLVVTCAPGQLDQMLSSLAGKGKKMVFLDRPGTIGSDIEAALAASHFVLIPVTLSVCDLKACLATARAARRLGKPFAFVLSGCPTGTQRVSEAAALLSKLSVLAGAPIHRRMVYQDASLRALASWRWPIPEQSSRSRRCGSGSRHARFDPGRALKMANKHFANIDGAFHEAAAASAAAELAPVAAVKPEIEDAGIVTRGSMLRPKKIRLPTERLLYRLTNSVP